MIMTVTLEELGGGARGESLISHPDYLLRALAAISLGSHRGDRAELSTQVVDNLDGEA